VSDWDEAEHPRHPAKAPKGRGGQFRLAASASHLITANSLEGWVKRVSQRLAGPVPPEWTPVSQQQYRADLHAELSRDMPPDVVDEIFADYEWPAGVWRAGDHVVTIQSPHLLGMAGPIFQHLNEMQRRFPVAQAIRFSVVPERNLGGDRGTSIPGTGIFYISDETFDDWAEVDDGGNPVPHDYTMPVGRPGPGRVEQWRYAMTHEWGHLVDPGAQDHNLVGYTDMQRQAQDMVEDWEQHLSIYGRRAAIEATAEAFAEWFLTQGRTDNEAAQAYAAWLGWRWQ
jgi:hypothetical protein